MKKEYIRPEIQVHEIETQQILTGSGEQYVDLYSDEIPEDENEDMW